MKLNELDDRKESIISDSRLHAVLDFDPLQAKRERNNSEVQAYRRHPNKEPLQGPV